MNLKLQFLIKSGYYIVPSPSTALMLSKTVVAVVIDVVLTSFSSTTHFNFASHRTMEAKFCMQRLIPKICEYATQHAEAGSEQKVRNQRNQLFKNSNFLNVISLIFDLFFRHCLRMLCSIFANFGNQPLVSYVCTHSK